MVSQEGHRAPDSRPLLSLLGDLRPTPLPNVRDTLFPSSPKEKPPPKKSNKEQQPWTKKSVSRSFQSDPALLHYTIGKGDVLGESERRERDQ